MSRKSSLLHELNEALRFHKFGNPRYRNKARQEMKLIITDMISLGVPPRSLKSINERMVRRLVNDWKSRKLSISTVMNKLSILRRLFKLMDIDKQLPSNKDLDVHWTEPRQKITPIKPEEIIKRLEHSITKTILEFQMYFGLTRQESIKLHLSFEIDSLPKHITVTRNYAHNSKDRFIPISTKEQKRSISKRLKILEKASMKVHSLNELAKASALSSLYNADFLVNEVNPIAPYRNYYVIQRYNQLQADKEQCSDRGIIETISQEIGIKKHSSVIAIIKHSKNKLGLCK
tara:strand:+ start:467 stop:1333 length:867 start_codon:yes stop_codon:yes gene_type:complete